MAQQQSIQDILHQLNALQGKVVILQGENTTLCKELTLIALQNAGGAGLLVQKENPPLEPPLEPQLLFSPSCNLQPDSG